MTGQQFKLVISDLSLAFFKKNEATSKVFDGKIIIYSYRGRPEEPAILISRLLLRMRGTYVSSIRLQLH